MFARNTFLIALLLFASFGCNKNRRLEGKWEFDRTYTESQLATGEVDPSSSVLTSSLIGMFDGITLTFESDEVYYTDANGSGKSENYEIIERPNSNSWKIKTGDGRIDTWFRKGERLVVSSYGDARFKTYFRRAKK